MLRIGVLCNSGSWYYRDLERAAAGRHQLQALSFRRLVARVAAGDPSAIFSGDCDLRTLDALLVRTMPPGSLEQVVLRMDMLGQLESSGALVLNPPRAIEAAVDKYLALARLARSGLHVPETVIAQEVEDAMEAFHRLGGDVVLKPLFGSEGRGLTRLNDEALALRAFKMLAPLGAVLYLQRYVPHEHCDYRLLVIGERVLGIQRRNPLDWRTNLSRGAEALPLVVDDGLRESALLAARAIGAPLVGVDLLPGSDGVLYALEVNAVPGWKGAATALEVDVAALILEYIERRSHE